MSRRFFALFLFLLQVGALSFGNEATRSDPRSGPTTNSRGLSEAPLTGRQSKSVIAGLVVSEATDQPVSNALVRASSPAMELRGVREPQAGVYDARTDPTGRFKLELPPGQTVSINVLAPGYEEAAGQWMSRNTKLQNIPFATAQKPDFKIMLRPALYVTGVVTDELKRPVPRTHVEATMRESRGFGYVAFDETDAKGRFEVFDFAFRPTDFDGGTNARAQVVFEHPDMLRTTLRDIYALPEEQRTNLQITLRKGHQITGTIASATGQLLPGLLVEAIPAAENAARKSAITDSRGRFTLRGLQGEVALVAHALALKQKARKVVRVADEDVQTTLLLEPILYKDPLKIVTLFGMKLANVTPEVQETYGLFSPTGVVILDPGKNHFRLGIGSLTEGESFWIVGNRIVNNIRDMIFEILRISAIDPPGQPNEGCRGRVRIVYQYPRRAGTNTQSLTLNDSDMRELMELAATLQ